MRTATPTTPTWLPTLVSALFTVGATWTTIQTQVPAIVQQEVDAELQHHHAQLMQRADSLWAATEGAIMARVDQATTHAADTVLSRLGFIERMSTTAGGRPQYVAPQVVVEQDTALSRRMEVALAVITTRLVDIQAQLDEQPERRTRRGRDR